MEEIIQQYGKPILIIAVVVALLAIFAILLSTTGTDGGLIMGNFKNLINNFFDKANGFIDSISSGKGAAG